MSNESIRDEVQRLLAQADEKVRHAEGLYAQGSDAQKVQAAGQLVFLKKRKAELEARMAELDQGPRVGQWLKEDWMVLMHRLDAFLEQR